MTSDWARLLTHQNVCRLESKNVKYRTMAAKTSKKVTAKKNAQQKPGDVSSAGKENRPRKKAPKKVSKSAGRTVKKSSAGGPVLLSGGNPQIAKADGDAPVQAYIAAMPGWKREVGRRLDTLIVKAVPTISKAVKWNSPFYGMDGKGWFLSFHCFNKYVKVAFLFGRSLTPMPPGESKDPNARYLDIHEDDELDEARFASWVRQGAEGPGWIP